MATLNSGDVHAFTPPGRSEVSARHWRRWFAPRRGETAATLEGAGQWLTMARDDTCRITDVCDFPIRCRAGTLWVTAPEDPGDSVVAAGEQLSVTSRGTILVAAIAASSMWVPEGFVVDEAEGTSRRRVVLCKLRRVARPPSPATRAPAALPRPTSAMARLAPLQTFIKALSRILTPSTAAALEQPGTAEVERHNP